MGRTYFHAGCRHERRCGGCTRTDMDLGARIDASGLVGFMSAAVLVAQVLTASGFSGGRPFLVLTLLAGAMRWDQGEFASLWLTSDVALACFAVLAMIEYGTRTDADFEELLRPFLRGLSVVAGALVADMIATLGADPALTSLPTSSSGSLPSAALSNSGLMTLGAVTALGAQVVREKALMLLQDFASPRRALRWLETGGIAGLVVAVLLAPVLAVIIALGLALLGALASLLMRAVRRRYEARTRTSCGCGFAVRHEASRCPSCGARRENA